MKQTGARPLNADTQTGGDRMITVSQLAQLDIEALGTFADD
ncbi:hypothetical protein AB0I22_23305 [Streptomyces sp. NPDC050610]